MSDSSLSDKTVFRSAHVFIESSLDIESLGRIISEQIAGGVPFKGLDEDIRDEVPAIYIRNLLGCRLILLGYPGEAGYNLELAEQDFPHALFRAAGKKPTIVDLSGNLYACLKDIAGLSVSV
jgi:hypothetical protein